jgi:hypothetical protein
MYIVIDFDGTIVYDRFPNVGKLKPNAKKYLRRLKDEGHTLILWTCREENKLYKARMFLAEHGIYFDYINMHPIEKMEEFKNDCRKIIGDIIIDDRNLGGIPEDWKDIYKMIKQHEGKLNSRKQLLCQTKENES